MNNEPDVEAALRSRTIAVVGASRDPTKDSNTVTAYLMSHGYKVIPVNPTANEILGEVCYKSLLDIPPEIARTIELVDIFRPSRDIPPIVEQAVQLRKMYGMLQGVWMQLGISNTDAAELAREAGLYAVQDACIRVEHGRARTKTIAR